MTMVSTDPPDWVASLDRATLAPIVARALDREPIDLISWRAEPIDYDVFLPGRAIIRVAGTARASGDELAWSVILKHTTALGATANQHDPGGRREVLAYESGLLDDLAGGLVAPRFLALNTDDAGARWLWLEDVADDYAGPWPLTAYGRAARHLGQFNGAYLTARPIPAFPWLQHNWAGVHGEPALVANGVTEVATRAEDPRVRRALPDIAPGQLAQLVRDQPRFVAILGQLPQTFCHHDASRPNLFARHVGDGWRTVAIDWESLGPGAVGAEVATLVFGSVRRGAIGAGYLVALDHVIYAGYLRGLRDAGWRGDEALARLGFCAAISLRWFQLRGTLDALTADRRPLRGRAVETPDQALRQFLLLSRFQFARAEEARGLARRLGLG